jgi:hypothetical protein
MKKTSRKALSLFLAVLMLCSIMSVTAFASPTDPEITVYFTRGNFTPGGYDFANETYLPSVYQGTSPTPAASTAFANDLFAVTVSLSSIDTTATRAVYASSGQYTGNINALDVIITALIAKSRSPYGGWDSWSSPAGGYISGFLNDGSTSYNGYTIYEDEGTGNTYYHYTGTNWQIAYNTTFGGNLSAASVYGSSITNLFDGMVIVFDLSDYDMYYLAP